MDEPLSATSVSLKLEEIQRRCKKLEEEPQALAELTLVDAEPESDGSDPYNRVRPLS